MIVDVLIKSMFEIFVATSEALFRVRDLGTLPEPSLFVVASQSIAVLSFNRYRNLMYEWT